jgi:NAD(P)-dependent dehydrogenase (short-subunit alcohol dehydrogenase family)
MSDLSSTTTMVVGASRGLGRGIVTALVEAGLRWSLCLAARRSLLSRPTAAGTGLQELS